MAADDADLYAGSPARRLAAARRLSQRARRRVAGPIAGWPTASPGARNAWLLLVTTKPPTWRDPLYDWPEGPLTLGELHPGFLYPDPIGFWDEVRRWANVLLRLREPSWSTAESLALTTLVHVGDRPDHLRLAVATCRPRLTVYLDEPAWKVGGHPVPSERLAVPDPHRPGQSYEGWWVRIAGGAVLGKSPQHPTMHRLYRESDLTDWLQQAPTPTD